MSTAMLHSRIDELPLVHRGKVRETYEVDERHLLLVATDRLSAFDVVFEQPIPDKGAVLTRLSAWWFSELADLGRSHLVAADADQLPPPARTPELAARSMLVRRAERVDAECVVRGYLAGSGWAEYQRSGEVCGHRLPPGLREADRLPEPIFTPSTKAEIGHDENISRAQLADLVGADVARSLEQRSLALYVDGRASGRRGRPDPRRHEVRVRLDRRRAGGDRRAADAGLVALLGRRALRAGLEPAELRQAVRPRFRCRVGLEQGAARPAAAGRRDPGHPRPVRRGLRAPDRTDLGVDRLMHWLAEVHVALRPGIADPEGQTIGSALRSLGYASVSEVRSGKLMRIAFEADDHAAAEATVDEMCRRLLANPVMETARWELRVDEQQDAEEPIP